MAEITFLRARKIVQQRARSADDGVLPVKAERIRAFGGKLLAKARRTVHIVKVRLAGNDAAEFVGKKSAQLGAAHRAGVQHDLHRMKTPQFVGDVVKHIAAKARGAEFAGRNIHKADAARVRLQTDGGEIIAFALVEHGGFRDRAGRDDAHDVPLNETLGKLWILNLLADGNIVPLCEQTLNVGVRAVIGHAAHGHTVFRILHVAVTRRQGEIQLLGSQLRVLVEHLVKVAQPEEKHAVRILCLDLFVLCAHGGECSGHAYSSLFSGVP